MMRCVACKLSLFMQSSEAVQAVKVSAFGRKKRGMVWPELCAWLDPEPGIEWERKWKREGNDLLRDRITVRRQRSGCHEIESRGGPASGFPDALSDEGEELDDTIFEEQEEDTDDDNESSSVRKAEAWAQSYNNLVGARPQTQWHQYSQPRDSYGATDMMNGSQYWEPHGPGETYGAEQSQAPQPRQSYGATDIISMYGHMQEVNPRESYQTRTSGFMRDDLAGL